MLKARLIASAALGAALAGCAPMAGGNEGPADRAASVRGDAALAQAIAATTRTPANVARDRFRNPQATLSFFGLKPGQTVVELWPSTGWYTEILAPYAKATGGTYYAAGPWERGLARTRERMTNNADLYGHIKLADFPAAGTNPKVRDGTADLVLTFRNVHSWRMGPQGEEGARAALRQAYAMLKPGGILGVVDHRLPENADKAREATSGYLKTSTVMDYAKGAGFEFVASSEINANPRDTTDHPEGVWTLPPALRLGDKDREKYLAIGESDRMTLKFRKPR